jgi:hypothetical protein
MLRRKLSWFINNTPKFFWEYYTKLPKMTVILADYPIDRQSVILCWINWPANFVTLTSSCFSSCLFLFEAVNLQPFFWLPYNWSVFWFFVYIRFFGRSSARNQSYTDYAVPVPKRRARMLIYNLEWKWNNWISLHRKFSGLSHLASLTYTNRIFPLYMR